MMSTRRVCGHSAPGGRRYPAMLMALVLMGMSAQAQSIYGSLRGNIADGQGGVIGGVKVSMLDESTNLSRSTLTNEAGEFSFASVTPATYKLVAEAPGFKKFERTGVVVTTQQSVALDVKMELGAVTESVMVTEEVPLLETSSASQGQVMDRQKLIDLPNLGRNPFMMSQAGAHRAAGGQPGVQPHAGPVRLIADFHRRRPGAGQQLPARRHSDHRLLEPRDHHPVAGSGAGDEGAGYHLRRRDGAHGRRHVQYVPEVRRELLSRLRCSATCAQTDWLANTFFNNRDGPGDHRTSRSGTTAARSAAASESRRSMTARTDLLLASALKAYRDTQAANRRAVHADRAGACGRLLEVAEQHRRACRRSTIR